MKKNYILTLLLLFSMNSFSNELVTFNYPPFLQENDKGFVDKLLVDFQKHSNFKINVRKYPVKRALRSFTAAKYDLHLGATDNFSKEELDSFHISPIIDLNIYLLFSKGSKEKLDKDLNTLSNIRIGILRGSKQEEDFANKLFLTPISTRHLQT